MTRTFQICIAGQGSLELTEENVIDAMEFRGFEFEGLTAADYSAHHDHFNCAPKFKGVLGPMHGGGNVCRYECPETYKALSQ